jgi:ATP-dependent Lhr-like helicase
MQHLTAMRFELPLGPDDAFRITTRAFSYRMLSREEFDRCREELPRVPRHEYMQNAGTIPETGVLKVYHGETFVGEVDEEFASMLKDDQLFLLAGRVWRYVGPGLARIYVAPSHEDADAPRWRGEGLGATRLLMGSTVRELRQGSSVYPWMRLQEAWAGSPVDTALVESYPHGALRALVFHTYLGRRANEALAAALSPELGESVATDAGFAIVTDRAWKPSRPKILALLAAPLEPRLREALEESDLLKRRLRHVLMRALVIRRREGEGLGTRQRYANRLLGILPEQHPLMREAYEECLRDAMEVDAAEEWRARVVAGELPLRLVASRPCGSPLAARILAPPAEYRHAALRENLDAISMYDSMIAH